MPVGGYCATAMGRFNVPGLFWRPFVGVCSVSRDGKLAPSVGIDTLEKYRMSGLDASLGDSGPGKTCTSTSHARH